MRVPIDPIDEMTWTPTRSLARGSMTSLVRMSSCQDCGSAWDDQGRLCQVCGRPAVESAGQPVVPSLSTPSGTPPPAARAPGAVGSPGHRVPLPAEDPEPVPVPARDSGPPVAGVMSIISGSIYLLVALPLFVFAWVEVSFGFGLIVLPFLLLGIASLWSGIAVCRRVPSGRYGVIAASIAGALVFLAMSIGLDAFLLWVPVAWFSLIAALALKDGTGRNDP